MPAQRIQHPTIVLLTVTLGLLFSGCVVKSTPVTTGSTTSAESAANAPAETATNGSSTAKPAQISKPVDTSSTITAEGSSTVYPLCQTLAVAFEKQSKHKVSVGRQGTSGGYKRFITRQADIWNASRPIDPKEVKELKEKGIDWIQLDVAVDGIVIAVNSKNTWCSKLTCAQLKQIWEPDSKIVNWQDLDPAWPAEPILLYGADTESGTFDYFTETINDKKKATNTKYTPASDDNLLVQGIAGNKGALGYIPFDYYIEHTETIKAVAISPTKRSDETPMPYVVPTAETINSLEYSPLSRPLFMFVSKESMKRSEVAEFLKYIVSDEAQELLEKAGFVLQKVEERTKTKETLQAALKELGQ